MELLFSAIVIAIIVWFFPLILAACAVLLCLFMALLVWIKELFIPGKSE